MQASKSELLERAIPSVALAYDILQQDDAEKRAAALQRVADPNAKNAGAVVQFFQRHKTGIAIVAAVKKEHDSRQTDLATEQTLKELQAGVDRIRELAQEPLSVDALSNSVQPLWKKCIALLGQELALQHKLSVEVICKHFWEALEVPLRRELTNTTTGCLEYALEAWSGKGLVGGLLGPSSGSQNPSVSDVIDLADTVTCLQNKALAEHAFWQDCKDQTPAPLYDLLTRYKKVMADASSAIEIAFAMDPERSKVFQQTVPSIPSAETCTS